MRPSVPLLLCLAALAWAGCASDCPEAPGLAPGRCAAVRALLLPEALPPSRGSRVADSQQAALLGFGIFYDARFSANQEVRCATCHLPERRFHDGRVTSQGLGAGRRNSPSLLNAAWMRWQTWDGHADSLWSQPLFAFEHPLEMDYTRLEVARAVLRHYRPSYEALFGLLPPLDDTARFPLRGGPGHPAWEGMAPADREAVDRVVANVGKALEAYMRKLAARRSALDRHLLGEEGALTPQQQRGLVVYATAGCIDCHGGPLLTDEAFRPLGLSPAPGQEADLGRAEGLARLLDSPFNAFGPFHDGAPPEDADLYAARPEHAGAFRTPSLRNVALTAPYGHDGRFATLEGAVEGHLRGADLPPGSGVAGLPAEDREALLAFLGALNGEYPKPPWNNWPDR
jgi:cytochrome c peroxidase